MSENKLQSLQGLRGISIILVLIFHLYPKQFVNGFVGVDMFFVLSGYLMTRILTKNFTTTSVVNFYKKRFNRIVPLYYFTIFASILGVLVLVLKTERGEFLLDIKWCLSLLSNFQPIFEHHSYWDQVSTIRFLTHLWSLATELQYYLMVPIIHLIASNLPFSLRITGYSIAILILFFFQLLTPFELSYCFLAARVWQFLLGSVAFDLSKKNDIVMDLGTEKKKKENESDVADWFPYLFLGALSTVVTLPWYFGEHTTRHVASFLPKNLKISRLIMSIGATGVCFLCGRLEQSFLTLQPLIFIGDISYVTYLIHWPVINFVRYIQLKDESILSINEALLCIAIIFALSLLAHYTLERKLLQLDFYVNLSIVVFTIGACLAMISLLENQECLAMKTLSTTLREKAEFNLNDSNVLIQTPELGCDYNETTAGLSINTFGIEYCSHKSNGTGKILVIGNSLSIRAFSRIFKLFNGKYEELRLFAKHGGAPLFNIFPYYTQAALDMAQEMKPELIWIIQGVNEISLALPGDTVDLSPAALDVVVPTLMNKFKELAPLVYVDLPYYVNKWRPAKLIARSLVYRKALEDHLAISLLDVEDQVEDQTERLLNLNCTNCYFNDVQKALTKGQDKFYLYEEDTYRALVYDGSHLAFAGFDRIQPLYKKRIEQFYEYLDKKRLPE